MPVGAIAMLGKGNSSNRSMVMSHGVAVYIYRGGRERGGKCGQQERQFERFRWGMCGGGAGITGGRGEGMSCESAAVGPVQLGGQLGRQRRRRSAQHGGGGGSSGHFPRPVFVTKARRRHLKESREEKLQETTD